MFDYIVLDMEDDDVTCQCGNNSDKDGFYPSDPFYPAAIQPEVDYWDGKTWVCGRCNVLIRHSGKE